MICPSCGIEIPDDSTKCPYCQEELGDFAFDWGLFSEEPEEEEAAEAPVSPKDTPEEADVEEPEEEAKTQQTPPESPTGHGFRFVPDRPKEKEAQEKPKKEKPAKKDKLKKEPKEKKKKPAKQEKSKAPEFKAPQINPVFLAAGAAVIVIVIAAAVFLSSSKKETVIETLTVNLSDYLTVSYDGPDGYASAEASFDYAAFMTDWDGVLSWQEEAIAESVELYYDGSWVSGQRLASELDFSESAAKTLYQMIDDCADAGGNANLSNGDTVVLTLNIDDDVLSSAAVMFGCEFYYEDVEVTVEGLEEAEEYDPFSHVTVSYTGLNGSGKAVVSNSGTSGIDADLTYEVSPEGGLSNDDTVTVTVTNMQEKILEEYGVVLSPQSQAYKVSGLSGYVISSDDLTDDVMAKILLSGSSAMDAVMSDAGSDDMLMGEYTYIGYYLLTPKDSSVSSAELYLVYKIDAEIYYESAEGFVDEPLSWYCYVGFDGVTKLNDGTVSLDYEDYILPEAEFTFLERTITGYDDLDVLFNNLVAQRIGDFDYENHVADVDTGNTASIDWEEIPDDAFYYAGHYYAVFYVEGITWSQAKANAAARGGHLAVITSDSEKAAVQNLLDGYAWTGAYKVAGNTVFKWVTGEAYEYEVDDEIQTEDEVYLALGPSGWNAYKYLNGVYSTYTSSLIESSVNYYICEWE